MCLRHLLLAGVLGGMLAACGSPSEPSSATHVMGSVLDTAFRPLRGARVEIVDGPFAGMIKIADAHGTFEFVAAGSGTVTLRAEQDGFESSTTTTDWTAGNRTDWATLLLKPTVPALSITPGPYTLTVGFDRDTADPSCLTDFPADLASRTYDGAIRVSAFPNYTYDFVALRSSTLIKSSGNLSFGVAGQFVGFQSDDALFTEELPGFRYLMIYGQAPTTDPATSTEISIRVPFSGTFRYCRLKSALGGHNDCSQVPYEQIIELAYCSPVHGTMLFTKP